MRRIFVTGIGTDVGKTVVSAIITEALKADYWKPVQCGLWEHKDSDSVRALILNNQTKIHREAYLFKEAMSPHAAAEKEGIKIDIEKISPPETNNHLVIEGAGGLMVPLNDKYLVIDLIKKFDAEVVLVVKHYLGSINHTLLSIDALKSRNINIIGVVFNGQANPDSEKIILNYYPFKFKEWVSEIKELKFDVIKMYSNMFSNL